MDPGNTPTSSAKPCATPNLLQVADSPMARQFAPHTRKPSTASNPDARAVRNTNGDISLLEHHFRGQVLLGTEAALEETDAQDGAFHEQAWYVLST